MRLKVPPKIPKNALVGSSSSPNFLFFFKKNGVQPDLVLFLRPGGVKGKLKKKAKKES